MRGTALFVLNKWRSLNLRCDWHNLCAVAGTKWFFEQKYSTCVKSMIAWEGVHLCSRHVFSKVTGQCSALLLLVKLSLTHYCENYSKCWRELGISYLSIKPRRKASLNKLTITWTIRFRFIDYCWGDWAYSFHVLNFPVTILKACLSATTCFVPVISPSISPHFAEVFSYSFNWKPDKASSGILTNLREHMEIANKPKWLSLLNSPILTA